MAIVSGMTEEFLQYDKLVEAALRGVVRSALQAVERHGLYGAHHFYITFQVGHPDVVMPPYLRQKYTTKTADSPSDSYDKGEMTIVLQYQFNNLKVTEDKFHVSLSFNNVEEHLTIPFAAITGFADPSVKFGLQFHGDALYAEDEFEDDITEQLRGQLLDHTEKLKEETAPATASKAKKSADKTAGNSNVVSLDTFRKK
jgi:hypothetical protein